MSSSSSRQMLRTRIKSKGRSASPHPDPHQDPSATHRTVWIGSLLLATSAWIPILHLSRGMWSMPGAMGMPLGAFLAFWTVMVVAMMGPSLAPVASRHLHTVRLRTRRRHPVAEAAAFVVGYLLVWILFGLPIFGLAALEGYIASTTPPVALAGGAVILVVAGCYQLMPLQARCLAACTQRLGAHTHAHLASTHARYFGPLQRVSAGVAHGRDCLGACGGCMLALVAVGLMNVPWMIALTLIVYVEKVWRHGDVLARVVGVGLALLGVLAAVDPRLVLGW